MGAVKELLSRGPDMDELVWWANEYVVSGLRKPYAEIKRYAEEFDMTPEQFKSFCNLHLNMNPDEEVKNILREIVYHIDVERKEKQIKNKNTMKESILMPSFKELKEGENKKMKGEDPCWDGYEMVGTKKKDGKEVPNCVKANESLNEDHNKECSDEVGMAKIQLKSIMAEAGELLQSLDQCEQLDAWVQSKISIAEDYITTVNKYMKFEEEEAPKELPLVPAEGPGPDVIDEIPAETPDEDPEPIEGPIEMELDDIEMPPLDLAGPDESPEGEMVLSDEEPEEEDLEIFAKED